MSNQFESMEDVEVYRGWKITSYQPDEGITVLVAEKAGQKPKHLTKLKDLRNSIDLAEEGKD
jgi:hypothetical protein